MSRNQATRLDGIVIKMLSNFRQFRINRITEIINKIYNSGEMPEDLSRSIFVVMPKSGANEFKSPSGKQLNEPCKTKIIIRILMTRGHS